MPDLKVELTVMHSRSRLAGDRSQNIRPLVVSGPGRVSFQVVAIVLLNHGTTGTFLDCKKSWELRKSEHPVRREEIHEIQ